MRRTLRERLRRSPQPRRPQLTASRLRQHRKLMQPRPLPPHRPLQTNKRHRDNGVNSSRVNSKVNNSNSRDRAAVEIVMAAIPLSTMPRPEATTR